MLALQVLLASLLLSAKSYDPIVLNPDKEPSQDGVTMVMLCSDGGSSASLTPQGRGSEVLSKIPPDGNRGAWLRGRTVRGNCDIWYHHDPLNNPHAYEACLIGCDHDFLERLLLR
jgi:hypothetical protein